MATSATHFAYLPASTTARDRLVDPAKPLQAIVSVYEHPQLGWLMGAYVVECSPAGGLSLKYQRLLPENAEQFPGLLTDEGLKMVQLLDDVNPSQLYRRFAPELQGLPQFLQRFSQDPYKSFLFDFIHGRLQRALPALPSCGMPVYRAGKDGYPAQHTLNLVAEPAELNFSFTRTPEGTRYRISLTLEGKALKLNAAPCGLVTPDPAWLFCGHQLFTFTEAVDGKKLVPFFTKEEIFIPPNHERDYYERFLARLLERHEVHLQGISITEEIHPPVFELVLRRESEQRVTLGLQVCYGAEAMPVAEKREARVWVDEPAPGQVLLRRLRRNLAAERHVTEALLNLMPRQGLLDVSMPEQEAYHWLVAHHQELHALGLQITALPDAPQFVMAQWQPRPVLRQVKAEYRLALGMRADGVALTPAQLKGLLAKETARVVLGQQVSYLPDAWLADLAHLAEVATWQGDQLVLSPHQLNLLPAWLRDALPPDALPAPLLAQHASAIQPAELPKGLQAKLRDYQQAGFDWLWFLHSQGWGGILADDMGLGKTLQALALLLKVKEDGPARTSLVVVPNSLVFNWLAEAKRFAPALEVAVYGGTRRQDAFGRLFRPDVMLTTYGMARQDQQWLAEHGPYHYIILDESQYIKNRDAKTTQAIMKLPALHRLSLTGTPIENATFDLWTQMQFLNPGLLGSGRFFERHYAIPIEKEGNAARAVRLRELIRPFVLRRTKDQVAKELPPLVEQVQYCDMLPQQAELYEQVRQGFRRSFFGPGSPSLEKNRLQILSGLQRLRQIAIDPRLLEPESQPSGKYETFRNLLADLLATDGQVIIFSQFVKLLTIVRKDLDAQQIAYSYLDGHTRDRAQAVEQFQQGQKRVFLISLKAGGVGLNLTAAEYVLMLDPWWNPAVERQALNRAHRIGQSRTVFAHKFITTGTIEEKILQLQQRKAQLAEEIIATEEDFFKNLTVEDLMGLFE